MNLNREGTAQEITNTIALSLSSEALFVTGANIEINGELVFL